MNCTNKWRRDVTMLFLYFFTLSTANSKSWQRKNWALASVHPTSPVFLLSKPERREKEETTLWEVRAGALLYLVSTYLFNSSCTAALWVLHNLFVLHKCRLNITMLVQSLTKTKNSPAKIRITNGLLIEAAKSTVTRLVSHPNNITYWKPSPNGVEDTTHLVEWPLKMVESIPELERRLLIHLAKVVNLTGLWGLIVARKSLLDSPGSKGLKTVVCAS